jgi:hypothetical protein
MISFDSQDLESAVADLSLAPAPATTTSAGNSVAEHTPATPEVQYAGTVSFDQQLRENHARAVAAGQVVDLCSPDSTAEDSSNDATKSDGKQLAAVSEGDDKEEDEENSSLYLDCNKNKKQHNFVLGCDAKYFMMGQKCHGRKCSGRAFGTCEYSREALTAETVKNKLQETFVYCTICGKVYCTECGLFST